MRERIRTAPWQRATVLSHCGTKNTKIKKPFRQR
jgi:hypothetical protein